MYNYDWFNGGAFEQQQEDAKWRCALRRFPEINLDEAHDHPEVTAFIDKLEVRKLIYLRDGFSYELKGMADVDSKSFLTFECEPVDEQYKVGAFVVSVPFEDIVRVEVFAVHADEKPEDMPLITGFRGRREPPSTRDAPPPERA